MHAYSFSSFDILQAPLFSELPLNSNIPWCSYILIVKVIMPSRFWDFTFAWSCRFFQYRNFSLRIRIFLESSTLQTFLRFKLQTSPAYCRILHKGSIDFHTNCLDMSNKWYKERSTIQNFYLKFSVWTKLITSFLQRNYFWRHL